MIWKMLNRLSALANLQAMALHHSLLSSPKYADRRRLANYEMRIYSQNGEDGVINYILSALRIESGSFLEIGVGDGCENNTRALLARGWKGVWLDGNHRHIKAINKSFKKEIEQGFLIADRAMVSPENIDEIIGGTGLHEVDVLSLDVDLCTHHIWRSLSKLNPAIAVIEYNAMWAPPTRWEEPYDASGMWDGRSLHFGASLQAIADIAKEKGYVLIGCELCGVNAFFIRSDLFDERHFIFPNDVNEHYEPPRYLISPPGSRRWK